MSSSDFTWLIEHGAEIVDRYAGRWIAVHNGEVVGVGDTATEAADKARTAVPDEDFILEAVDQDADVIYACVRLAPPADEAFRSSLGPLC